jgi:hypothetical protein
MLNLPAPGTSKNPGTAGCREITVSRSPDRPGSKSPGTLVGRGSIPGPRSELRKGQNCGILNTELL